MIPILNGSNINWFHFLIREIKKRTSTKVAFHNRDRKSITAAASTSRKSKWHVTVKHFAVLSIQFWKCFLVLKFVQFWDCPWNSILYFTFILFMIFLLILLEKIKLFRFSNENSCSQCLSNHAFFYLKYSELFFEKKRSIFKSKFPLKSTSKVQQIFLEDLWTHSRQIDQK